jgi:anti-sigma B factor antagonist
MPERTIIRALMKLTERAAGDVTVLTLDGRLVLEDGDTLLRDRVNDLIGRGRLKVVLNLKDVTYIDSCGIGVLIAKLVSLRNKGGDLKLVHLSPRSYRVLEICKLEEVFECFEAEESAVASFSNRQKV